MQVQLLVNEDFGLGENCVPGRGSKSVAQVMECRAGEGVEARENGKEVHIFSHMFISKSTPSGP